MNENNKFIDLANQKEKEWKNLIQKELDKCNYERDLLSKQFTALQNENAKLNDDFNHNVQLLKQYETETDRLEAVSVTQQQQMSTLQHQLSDAKIQLDSYQNECTRLRDEKSALHEQLQQALSDSVTALNKLRLEKQAEIDSLKTEHCEKLKLSEEEVHRARADLEQHRETWQNQLQSVLAEKDTETRERTQTAMGKALSEELRARIADQEVRQLKEVRQQLTNQVVEKEREAYEARLAINELELALQSELSIARYERDTAVEQAVAERTTLKDKLERLQTRLTQSTAQNERDRHVIEKLQRGLADLKLAFDKRTSQLEAECTSKVATLNEALLTTEQRFKVEKTRFDDEQAVTRAEMEQRATKAEHRAQEITQQLKDSETELARLRQLCEDRDAELERDEALLHQMKQSRDEAVKRCEELERRVRLLDQYTGQEIQEVRQLSWRETEMNSREQEEREIKDKEREEKLMETKEGEEDEERRLFESLRLSRDRIHGKCEMLELQLEEKSELIRKLIASDAEAMHGGGRLKMGFPEHEESEEREKKKQRERERELEDELKALKDSQKDREKLVQQNEQFRLVIGEMREEITQLMAANQEHQKKSNSINKNQQDASAVSLHHQEKLQLSIQCEQLKVRLARCVTQAEQAHAGASRHKLEAEKMRSELEAARRHADTDRHMLRNRSDALELELEEARREIAELNKANIELNNALADATSRGRGGASSAEMGAADHQLIIIDQLQRQVKQLQSQLALENEEEEGNVEGEMAGHIEKETEGDIDAANLANQEQQQRVLMRRLKSRYKSVKARFTQAVRYIRKLTAERQIFIDMNNRMRAQLEAISSGVNSTSGESNRIPGEAVAMATTSFGAGGSRAIMCDRELPSDKKSSCKGLKSLTQQIDKKLQQLQDLNLRIDNDAVVELDQMRDNREEEIYRRNKYAEFDESEELKNEEDDQNRDSGEDNFDELFQILDQENSSLGGSSVIANNKKGKDMSSGPPGAPSAASKNWISRGGRLNMPRPTVSRFRLAQKLNAKRN